jgi:UDP-N-acetylmuramoyl-L-alanyl-D-glutamate--2,6-diaminopimelate ligase
VHRCCFDLAVFTNISRDHFDYHGSMENYAAAKRRLFHMPHLRSAVINLDDPMGRALLETLAEGVGAWVYSLNDEVEMPHRSQGWVKAESIRSTPAGLEIEFNSNWGRRILRSGLLGRFNAANLLAVLLVLMEWGMSLDMALSRLEEVKTVAGRMESFGTPEQPMVVIDYAHTPDALEKALLACREHTQGKLWVVFGCGGDRDRGKRPQMGELAERLADRVIVTDDNPRTEAGGRIIDEIVAGMSNPSVAEIERERAAAIRQAVMSAQPGDLVLVAGKGHEDYQLIGEERYPFSDQQQVLQSLQLWGGAEA